jgi:hypothetical protein
MTSLENPSAPGDNRRVDERTRRRAANEVAFRDANERVREVAEGFQDVADRVGFICECGRSECLDQVEMTLAEYEEVRSNPTHFVLTKGHDDPSVERVVAETDRYAVVAKHPGEPARVAIEEDPRN